MLVKGYVKDTNGKAIISASVMLENNNSVGDSTNQNGYFQLDVPAGSNLIISRLGFYKKTVKATSTMNIVLETNDVEIDEVLINSSIKKDKKGCGILCYTLITATLLIIIYKYKSPKKVVL